MQRIVEESGCYSHRRDGVDGEGDGVIAIAAIGVAVAGCIGEDAGGDRDDPIGSAVRCGRKRGGIGAAGTGEVGEAATGYGDIGLSEIRG